MPSLRASLRASGALAAALVRVAWTFVVAGFAAFALTLLAVRFVVFPQVEAYRDTLAQTLSQQLGHPVEIAALTTGWDGWNPKLLIGGFRVLDRARSGATPLLDLPEVTLVVAWTSLPFLDLRLKELVIDRPRLAIRRDRGGMLHVAGIEFDPAQVSDDTAFTDWLLRQPRILIRDALVTWDDDQRNAPQLVLDRVQFRLESRFGRHRFGLKGTPPAELAAPLDLRGDLSGVSMTDWQHADGELFVRLDYADVAAWREWLPLPGQIASGKGALRVWFQLERGEPREIVADLELADVRARLGDALPELELAHLSGRAGWRSTAAQREVFTRSLAFVTPGGERLDPTNFTLTLRDAAGGLPGSGQIEFEQLQLEPLVALAAHLPLAERIRADLARFAPRGTLARGRLRWDGAADSPTAFVAAADFTQLGFAAQDALPGATGLSGRLDATQDHGEVKVATGHATIDLPLALPAPVALDSLQSVVKWDRRDGKTAVRIEQLEFANADAAGSVTGTYRTGAQGPGEIDLVARASRADAAGIHRYLPRAADAAARDWLRTAIIGGTMTDIRVKLAGNLAQFPFPNGKGGQFIATAKARSATLAYADGWPAIDGIDADVRIDGTRLTIEATRGQLYGVDIGKTRAEIGDLAANVPLLRIDGEAAGPASGFLRFVNTSPVTGWIDHLTDGMEATGAGHLALSLSLPLRRLEGHKVVGELTLADAQLRRAGLPLLAKVNGKLSFTEREIQARDVAMEVLGGPARVAVATDEGRVRVTGGGTVNLVALRREFAVDTLNRLSGSVDWTFAVALRGGVATWVIESTMKGAVVDLPAPLGKAAAETMPLRIERRDETAQPGIDFITASYGGVARFTAQRKQRDSGGRLDRALLSLGRAVDRPDADRAERPGLWLRAEIPRLDVDEWLEVLRRKSPADIARRDEALAFAGADLDVGRLDALGVRLDDMKVRMREGQPGWLLDLNGRQVAGTATWTTPGAGAPNGRIVARLTRFAVPGRSGSAVPEVTEIRESPREPKTDLAAGNPWPEIDIVADSLLSNDRDLGRLEFVAQPRGAEWRIERLVLANSDGRLEAGGAWRVAGRAQQTKLDIAVDVKEAGAFLARFGYADALQGAPTKIDGQLAWSGAPHEFDYPSLAGTFHIGVGPGRFTKIEPGPAGKLLGVLSLQALPRRITLDFRDVFSEGFTFDEITGDVRIANGVMSTTDLKLVGPAAKVDITGDADLAKETQRLAVRVQPALSSSVSAGAALLFLANPLVGAVVGAGSLLAQAVLKDPIGQIFTYQYTVTGNWSDPVVTRSADATASVAPQTPAPPAAGGVR